MACKKLGCQSEERLSASQVRGSGVVVLRLMRHSGSRDFYAPKKLDMTFQLSRPLLDSKQALLKIRELGPQFRGRLAIIDLFDEKYH
jgi:hypothetical protein